MNILVLIKYSLDVAELKVDPATRELRFAGVPAKVGAIDKNAVEAAVQLVEKGGGTLKALTLGPESARDAFRDVLAMGVDEIFLVKDPYSGEADSTVAAQVLEAAIRKTGPWDLIVCGFASDDGYTFQIPPRLAERLALPLVSYVREMEAGPGELVATRALDDVEQVVSVPLPAVVSVDEEAFPPRRTTLMDALKAKQKPVHVWDMVADLGLDPGALDTGLAGELTWQEGIIIHRKQQVLRGEDLAGLAETLIDHLLEEKILLGGDE